MADARVNLIITAKDLASSVLAKIRDKWRGAFRDLAEGVKRLTLVVSGAIFALLKLSEAGERELAVTQRFKTAMAALGLEADGVARRLTAVTQGLVEQTNVQKLATRGMAEGKLTLEQLAMAMEFLSLKAVAAGENVQEFVARGIEGLSRGSSRALLEVFPDLALELERLANQGFSQAKDKAEALKLVFERMRGDLPGLRDDLSGLNLTAQQSKVRFLDLLSELQAQIAASPAVQRVWTQMGDALDKVASKLPDILRSLEGFFSLVVKVGGALGSLLLKAAEGFAAIYDVLTDAANTQQATDLVHQLAEGYRQLEQASATGNEKLKRQILANIRTNTVTLAREIRAGGEIIGAAAEDVRAAFGAVATAGGAPGQGTAEAALRAQGGATVGPTRAQTGGGMAPVVVESVIPETTVEAAGRLKVGLADLQAQLGANIITQDEYKARLTDWLAEAEKVLGRLPQTGEGFQQMAASVRTAKDDMRALEAAERDARQAGVELEAGQADLDKAFQQTQQAVEALLSTVKVEGKDTTVDEALQALERMQNDLAGKELLVSLGVRIPPQEIEALRKRLADTGNTLAEALRKALPPGEVLNGLLGQIQAHMDGAAQHSEDFEHSLGRVLKEAGGGLGNLSQTLSDLTTTTMREFEDAFTGAFEAMVDGSKSAGEAFKGAMLRAIAAIASGLGRMFLGKAVAAIGDALLGDPKGWAAAAKYGAAAAIMFALAGALKGASGGGSGGGGGGGAASAREDAAQAERRGETTITLQGDLWSVADPRVVDQLAEVMEAASGRRVNVTRSGDGQGGL